MYEQQTRDIVVLTFMTAHMCALPVLASIGYCPDISNFRAISGYIGNALCGNLTAAFFVYFLIAWTREFFGTYITRHKRAFYSFKFAMLIGGIGVVTKPLTNPNQIVKILHVLSAVLCFVSMGVSLVVCLRNVGNAPSEHRVMIYSNHILNLFVLLALPFTMFFNIDMTFFINQLLCVQLYCFQSILLQYYANQGGNPQNPPL